VLPEKDSSRGATRRGQQQINSAFEKLKATGVRITPQRQAILEYLIESMSHPTADEIYKALSDRFPNMSVATVYNNLRVFKDIGIVSELTFVDASSRYDANIEHSHYHVICRSCGKIVDFEYPYLDEVEREAAAHTGFKVEDHRLEIYGICSDCDSKKDAKQH